MKRREHLKQNLRGWMQFEVEKRILEASKDLLRIFASLAKQKVQKVYCSCKEQARSDRGILHSVMREPRTCPPMPERLQWQFNQGAIFPIIFIKQYFPHWGDSRRGEATKKCADRASSRGFSLIEMIIYAAILSVLTIVTINATFSAIKSFAEFRVSRDLNSSATSLLERMTREIRMAHGIDGAQSTLGANPGRLTLLTEDSGGANTTVEFYVENGALKIKEGGVAMGALTSSSTAVTNFVVRSLSNPKSSAIKTELGLTATRGGVSKSANFYSTILLRGGY